MTNMYDKGDRVTINTSTAFQDADGSVFDPDVVTFKVIDPAGEKKEYVYDQDDPQNQHAAITKNGTGDYTLTIDVDIIGAWPYYIMGKQDNGENRAADEGKFKVKSTSF